MQKEIELWQFIAERLGKEQNVMLLVVAESSGSSPGRPTYKMAVGEDGELIGSIGGGVMEVNLVEQSREILRKSSNVCKDESFSAGLKLQVHKKNVPDSSGMICSGKQTVIFKVLTSHDLDSVKLAVDPLTTHRRDTITITPETFGISPSGSETTGEDLTFGTISDIDFIYREKLGPKNDLFIIGGGHCALSLSELMSKMDFHISLFDDRPELNTIEKNRFADTIRIVDSYDSIDSFIPSATNAYVVVMTLGYKSDETVIRKLLGKEFKYFGVLGSKAKMATLMKALKDEGFPAESLAHIHTPIGLSINSRTPEEIAVSIAAEIITVKNSD